MPLRSRWNNRGRPRLMLSTFGACVCGGSRNSARSRRMYHSLVTWLRTTLAPGGDCQPLVRLTARVRASVRCEDRIAALKGASASLLEDAITHPLTDRGSGSRGRPLGSVSFCGRRSNGCRGNDATYRSMSVALELRGVRVT